MRSYLVELYHPRPVDGGSAAAASRARAEAAAVARAATRVRYVRSLFLLADETCFHEFEAPSADVLERAAQRVGLHYDRIVEAVARPDERTEDP